MKDCEISFGEMSANALFIPDHDGEGFLSFTEGGSVLGRKIEVEGLHPDHAKAIEEGQPGAIHDVFSPVDKLGYYRIIAGTAFIGQIEGMDPAVRYQLVSDNIFETTPEAG